MKKNLKYVVKEILTKKEISFMPTAFDVVGDILIFADFPKQLLKKEKKIGEAILKHHKNIKVVCRKTKSYGGTFRLPKLSIMAGERRKETVHRENGIALKLNVEKVYFSPRLGTERKRIMDLVNSNESVLVLFSGCGPYSIQIAKYTPCKEVFAIEINPIAHRYALENTITNKVKEKMHCFNGDVKTISKTIKKKFDRIIMPLPKDALHYLPHALSLSKKGATIHIYGFSREGEFDISEKNIMETCKKSGKSCKLIRTTPCGQYSPGTLRICTDIRVS